MQIPDFRNEPPRGMGIFELELQMLDFYLFQFRKSGNPVAKEKLQSGLKKLGLSFSSFSLLIAALDSARKAKKSYNVN